MSNPKFAFIPEKFTLEITMGNSEMSSLDDIAKALQGVARQLISWQSKSGPVKDTNGNSVGSFECEGEERCSDCDLTEAECKCGTFCEDCGKDTDRCTCEHRYGNDYSSDSENDD